MVVVTNHGLEVAGIIAIHAASADGSLNQNVRALFECRE